MTRVMILLLLLNACTAVLREDEAIQWVVVLPACMLFCDFTVTDTKAKGASPVTVTTTKTNSSSK